MFFHPVVKKEAKVVKLSAKDKAAFVARQEEYHKKIGLQPIKCVSRIIDDFRNDFGWLRNDIQQFLRTSDVQVQQSIAVNLQTVTQSGANEGATVQDVFNSIIPSNVQTPADIERFGRVMAKRFEGKFQPSTPVKELSEKVEFSKVDESVTDDK